MSQKSVEENFPMLIRHCQEKPPQEIAVILDKEFANASREKCELFLAELRLNITFEQICGLAPWVVDEELKRGGSETIFRNGGLAKFLLIYIAQQTFARDLLAIIRQKQNNLPLLEEDLKKILMQEQADMQLMLRIFKKISEQYRGPMEPAQKLINAAHSFLFSILVTIITNTVPSTPEGNQLITLATTIFQGNQQVPQLRTFLVKTMAWLIGGKVGQAPPSHVQELKTEIDKLLSLLNNNKLNDAYQALQAIKNKLHDYVQLFRISNRDQAHASYFKWLADHLTTLYLPDENTLAAFLELLTKTKLLPENPGPAHPILIANLNNHLFMAAQSGNLLLLGILQHWGIPITNVDENANTILHLAAPGGYIRFIQYVKDKIPANAINRNRQTALHIAIANGQTNTARILITCNQLEERDKDGQTALLIACDFANFSKLVDAERIQFECVKVLLDAGAKVDVRDNQHLTGLHYQAKRGNKKVIVALLQAGANPYATEDGFKKTPIQLAHDCKNSDIGYFIEDTHAMLKREGIRKEYSQLQEQFGIMQAMLNAAYSEVEALKRESKPLPSASLSQPLARAVAKDQPANILPVTLKPVGKEPLSSPYVQRNSPVLFPPMPEVQERTSQQTTNEASYQRTDAVAIVLQEALNKKLSKEIRKYTFDCALDKDRPTELCFKLYKLGTEFAEYDSWQEEMKLVHRKAIFEKCLRELDQILREHPSTKGWVRAATSDLCTENMSKDAKMFNLRFYEAWQAAIVYKAFKGIGLIANAPMPASVPKI